MPIINSLIIIFALIAIGLFAEKRSILSHTQIEGFEAFLFKIGLPCYLFVAALKYDIRLLLHTEFISSYLTTFLIITAIIALVYYRSASLSSILMRSLASGYSNIAIYALPIIIFLLKDPMSGIIGNIFQVVVIQSSIVTILNLIKHKEKAMVKSVVAILSTPLIVMPIIGLTLNYLQFSPGYIITTVVEDLGNSASTIALFAFGLRLGTLKVTKASFDRNLLFIIFTKNALHPTIAYCVGRYIFALEQYWLYSLVITASAPAAYVIYFIAKQFAVDEELMKLVVAISAIASLFSLVVITAVFF